MCSHLHCQRPRRRWCRHQQEGHKGLDCSSIPEIMRLLSGIWSRYVSCISVPNYLFYSDDNQMASLKFWPNGNSEFSHAYLSINVWNSHLDAKSTLLILHTVGGDGVVRGGNGSADHIANSVDASSHSWKLNNRNCVFSLQRQFVLH